MMPKQNNIKVCFACAILVRKIALSKYDDSKSGQ